MSDKPEEKPAEEKEEKTPKEVVESKPKKADNEVKSLQADIAQRDDTIAELKKAQKEMQSALTKLQGRPEHKSFFDELHAMLFGEDS